MTLLTPEVEAYIGMTTDWQIAVDPVERGAVRRFAQASMDDDEMFWIDTPGNRRFGGPVAQHLFPTMMFRPAFGAPDRLTLCAHDPDFDGTDTLSTQGLPPIAPFAKLPLLNGGSDIEFFSLASVSETVKVRSRYADISEKQTSKGPMILVVIETEYRAGDDRLLLKLRRTQIRRAEGART